MSEGKERLWGWFGLSYSSWLTMPRVMMHQMPDEWQDKMAALLEEWDETWDTGHLPEPSVMGRENGKLAKYPKWVLNYRHPDRQAIESIKINKTEDHPCHT